MLLRTRPCPALAAAQGPHSASTQPAPGPMPDAGFCEEKRWEQHWGWLEPFTALESIRFQVGGWGVWGCLYAAPWVSGWSAMHHLSCSGLLWRAFLLWRAACGSLRAASRAPTLAAPDSAPPQGVGLTQLPAELLDKSLLTRLDLMVNELTVGAGCVPVVDFSMG